jgi:indolepyruvate ferredoxin oxidoreductase
VNLADKYTALNGLHYLTGIQALVRLPIDQMRLDRARGWNTAAFISGYEGSPLGGYDLALARAGKILDEHRIRFQPAVNEDLAATAILGSQIAAVAGPMTVEGVVGIWYGKGPGVDRSHDALRHANLAGCPGRSAALVLAGDDHASKSSTIPHQSDFSLMNLGIPILAPGSTQEVRELGLAAIALSRYSGAWAALKLVTNVCDGGAVIDVSLERMRFEEPAGCSKVTDPMLVIPHTLAMEVEMSTRRLDAARVFARANRLDQIRHNAPGAKLGILTSGKAYYDTVEALRIAGMLGQARVAKLGMIFPLEPDFLQEFFYGLDRVLVVEEKRSFIEMQARELAANDRGGPEIEGKRYLPPYGEFTPEALAEVFAGREFASKPSQPWRRPNFCSGCPHNRSTILLDGQIAGGGTGCHGMAVMLGASGRHFSFATHMGGEGAPWIGMAPFSERKHIFQNIGDGTFFHSGSLAVQACVAAGVNITFKILYNGHVAMTGGQDAQGALPVPELTRKLAAEGVRRIIVIAEQPERYAAVPDRIATNAEVRPRDRYEETMRELESVPGVTALIYDQECATEKRRKRVRGKAPAPSERLVIHREVCEGCGDCAVKSNCMSLERVATPLGEKMRIQESSCNFDYTCLLGDCPSFVSLPKREEKGEEKRELPPPPPVPDPPALTPLEDRPYRILMPGIGGTGVVTLNAILAQAAHGDGLWVTTLDQTGLAQKGGAVTSHLTIARQPIETPARIALADLALGFDASGVPEDARFKVLNSPSGGALTLDATRLAEQLCGGHLYVNMMLTGFAWQAGLIPISRASIEVAIRLNGVEVERNLAAFSWGRACQVSLPPRADAEEAFDYEAALTAFQNARYAGEYREFVSATPDPIRSVVARELYRLMAYKDEYEVARLLTQPGWEGASYHLHPPLLRALGWKKKMRLGPWFRPILQVLAAMKRLRGTAIDPFGYTRHRREERALADWYRDLVRRTQETPVAMEAASLPASIRGYDEIKSQSIAAARRRGEELCATLSYVSPSSPRSVS